MEATKQASKIDGTRIFSTWSINCIRFSSLERHFPWVKERAEVLVRMGFRFLISE